MDTAQEIEHISLTRMSRDYPKCLLVSMVARARRGDFCVVCQRSGGAKTQDIGNRDGKRMVNHKVGLTFWSSWGENFESGKRNND